MQSLRHNLQINSRLQSGFINVYKPYFDGAQIHRFMDDVMIVMKAEPFGIHRLVERPGVDCVFLGEQLLQDATAVFKSF